MIVNYNESQVTPGTKTGTRRQKEKYMKALHTLLLTQTCQKNIH